VERISDQMFKRDGVYFISEDDFFFYTVNNFWEKYFEIRVMWPRTGYKQANDSCNVAGYRVKASQLSTQFRIVIGLLTGHNTLIRYLYIMGLSNNPTCRKCGTEEETSVPHFV
jgi:hypothetical protein